MFQFEKQTATATMMMNKIFQMSRQSRSNSNVRPLSPAKAVQTRMGATETTPTFTWSIRWNIKIRQGFPSSGLRSPLTCTVLSFVEALFVDSIIWESLVHPTELSCLWTPGGGCATATQTHQLLDRFRKAKSVSNFHSMSGEISSVS